MFFDISYLLTKVNHITLLYHKNKFFLEIYLKRLISNIYRKTNIDSMAKLMI